MKRINRQQDMMINRALSVFMTIQMESIVLISVLMLYLV